MFTLAQIHQATSALEYAKNKKQLVTFCNHMVTWGYVPVHPKATEHELRMHIESFISHAAIAINNSESKLAA
jgi:hypothetical protein